MVVGLITTYVISAYHHSRSSSDRTYSILGEVPDDKADTSVQYIYKT